MIKFKYKPNPNEIQYIRDNVSNFSGDKLFGYVEESRVNALKHLSLYVVCNLSKDATNEQYNNAQCIIGRNEQEAIGIYNVMNNSESSCILFQITDRCDKIKVEPVED